MEERKDERSSSPTPAARARLVYDHGAGCEWRIRLVDTRDVPGARSTACLIYDSGTTVRRVWSPPPNWHALSDYELLELMDRARPT